MRRARRWLLDEVDRRQRIIAYAIDSREGESAQAAADEFDLGGVSSHHNQIKHDRLITVDCPLSDCCCLFHLTLTRPVSSAQSTLVCHISDLLLAVQSVDQ